MYLIYNLFYSVPESSLNFLSLLTQEPSLLTSYYIKYNTYNYNYNYTLEIKYTILLILFISLKNTNIPPDR